MSQWSHSTTRHMIPRTPSRYSSFLSAPMRVGTAGNCDAGESDGFSGIDSEISKLILDAEVELPRADAMER